MTRYPRAARDAVMKCIDCNAPVVQTVDGRFVCVDCGRSPVEAREASASPTLGVNDPQPSES